MDIINLVITIEDYFLSETKEGRIGTLQYDNIDAFSERICNTPGLSEELKEWYDYRIKYDNGNTTRKLTDSMKFSGRYKFYRIMETDLTLNETFKNTVCDFIKDTVNPFFGRNF